MDELTLYLADIEAALAEVRKTPPGEPDGIASLTTHHGTLHVFLSGVAAYGLFTAALAERLVERAEFEGTSSAYSPLGSPAAAAPAAIARAARTTWDDQLAEKGWTDGGVLGVWYPGVTIIETPFTRSHP